MNIFWLQQAERDVPVEDQWLTPGELHRLRGMRFPQRRRDWRLGRWTAKCAVASYLEWPSRHDIFTDIEVRTAPSGAPEVLIQGTPGPVVISLSHRVGVAICAVASTGAVLGCDLEKVEPRSQAFISDYFTAEEQSLLGTSPAADQHLLVALLWSAKESALKALGVGLRASTHSAVVTPDDLSPKKNALDCLKHSSCGCCVDDSPWQSLCVRCVEGGIFYGWWKHSGELLRTIVSAPPSRQPLSLALPLNVFSETTLEYLRMARTKALAGGCHRRSLG